MLAASKSAKLLPKIFKPRKAQILSWCKFKRGLPCPDKPHHLDSVFKEPLEKIYDRLSEPALLIICLPGYTQNANEFVDALAWNKCPKHELHGRKGIVMAASCAALHFSCGATTKKLMSLGKLKSHLASTIGRKQDKALDSGRIQLAEHRAQEKHKQFRLVRRHAR